MTIGKEYNADQLSLIYREMNETGKKKLKLVADQIMGIWSTVNGETAKPASVGLNKEGVNHGRA